MGSTPLYKPFKMNPVALVVRDVKCYLVDFNQTKSNTIKDNQTKSNTIKQNQTQSNTIKHNQTTT